MRHIAKLKNQAGFTLVELALVMAITGVVLGAAIGFAIPLMETANQLSTVEKMKKVESALALYAVQNYRVPCPAVPIRTTTNPIPNGFGYERNNGSPHPSRCGDSANALRGIVPFKTLGLPEDIVKDAWGNYFTYAINPFFALPPSTTAASIHARCRTKEWLYKITEAPRYKSRNAAKAGFCCPGKPAPTLYDFNSNLYVRDDTGNDVLFRSRNYDMTGVNEVGIINGFASGYEDFDNPTAYVPVEETPVGVVYVLISHGKNGSRTAFNGRVNSRDFVPSSATSPCEAENANDNTGDRIYRDCELAEDVSVNPNDDITLWRTQDMMFASEGQSCATP